MRGLVDRLVRVASTALGRYPEERLGGVEGAGSHTAFVVEVVGLVVLAAGILGLAGRGLEGGLGVVVFCRF